MFHHDVRIDGRITPFPRPRDSVWPCHKPVNQPIGFSKSRMLKNRSGQATGRVRSGIRPSIKPLLKLSYQIHLALKQGRQVRNTRAVDGGADACQKAENFSSAERYRHAPQLKRRISAIESISVLAIVAESVNPRHLYHQRSSIPADRISRPTALPHRDQLRLSESGISAPPRHSMERRTVCPRSEVRTVSNTSSNSRALQS